MAEILAAIAIGTVLAWMLAGCHRPTFSLVNVEAAKPQRTGVEGRDAAVENTENSHEGPDALERDERWNQLKK